MKKIEIEWAYDEHDCETCGSAYATGAHVKIDGEPFGDFEPVAACYNGSSFEPEIIWAAIIKHLGCEVIETQQSHESNIYEDEDD